MAEIDPHQPILLAIDRHLQDASPKINYKHFFFFFFLTSQEIGASSSKRRERPIQLRSFIYN
jgi:hypothetical protein